MDTIPKNMHPRARQLIGELQLQVHPEGGFYREVHRSALAVRRHDGDTRSALTTIYYLMVAGEPGQWHRVSADEIWHFYEGDVLELAIADPEGQAIAARRLGPLAADAEPVRVVPAACWQSARTLGAYTLVGCSVGPGFDFADFVMLRDLSVADVPLRDRLLAYESSTGCG
jgi:predicted cupin superfamily sugar epimerase